MEKYTLSLCRGAGSLNHNNRTFIAPNIDKSRTHLNVTLERTPLEDEYEKIFGLALKEYNARQTRKDCKIDNYLEHIKKSKNREKIFHEVIVELGDKAHHPDAKKAIKMFTKFLEEFKKKNPNLITFNVTIHLDEATPHMHVDFIPVKKIVKKGLKIQNSKKGAFQEMGYGSTKPEYVRWLDDNKKILADIAIANGIGIEDGHAAGERKEDINIVRKVMRTYEQEMSHIPQVKYREYKTLFQGKTNAVIIKQRDLESINRKEKLATIIIREAMKIENNCDDAVKRIKAERDAALADNKRFQKEKKYWIEKYDEVDEKYDTMKNAISDFMVVLTKNTIGIKGEVMRAAEELYNKLYAYTTSFAEKSEIASNVEESPQINGKETGDIKIKAVKLSQNKDNDIER